MANKVSYKLHYFDVNGRAAAIRQMFALTGQEYEDYRIPLDMELWAKLKTNYAFQQLPVLEVNGKPLSQQNAICRFLARQYGFAGKGEWEQAMVDAYGDQIQDFITAQFKYWVVAVNKLGKGDVEEVKKEFLIPAVKQYFPIFIKAIEGSGSGYLVGSNFTWADLVLADFYDTLARHNPEFETEYPALAAHRNKMHSIPRIKQCREAHPRDF